MLNTMNLALTKHFEEMIARLVASRRFNNSSEVVRAGLRILSFFFTAPIANYRKIACTLRTSHRANQV
jgi:Arc/MetJ-type ribon-helix-helix transcriptional regulator